MIEISEKKTLVETPIFDLHQVSLKEKNTPFPHPFYQLSCQDWINILPITNSEEAILIKQFRAGSMNYVLETPGGVVDQGEDKDPTLTALRELEEETGYTSEKILFLGSMNPNPAFQNNRLHCFLALSAHLKTNRELFPDPGERIEVCKVPVQKLEEMVYEGKIDHCLSALCILLSKRYLRK